MSVLDLSIQNPQFAKLRTLKPAPGQNSLAIPNSALPKSVRAGLGLAYKTFTGKGLPADESAMFATFADGEFSRLYSPAVYKVDGALVLKWGNELLPITIDGQEFVIGEGNGELVREKFGKYDETLLSYFIEDEDGNEVTFKAPIKAKNYKEAIEPAKMKAQLKKGNMAALLELVAEPGSVGEANKRPKIDVKLDQAFDIRQVVLAQPTEAGAQALEFICWGAQRIKTSYGNTYALRIPNQPGFEQFMSAEESVGTAWSQKSLNTYFEGGFAPTEENPATLTLTATPWQNDATKFSYKAHVEGDCWLDDEDEGLDLSFIAA